MDSANSLERRSELTVLKQINENRGICTCVIKRVVLWTFKVLDLLNNMQVCAQRMSVLLQTMYLALFFFFLSLIVVALSPHAEGAFP